MLGIDHLLVKGFDAKQGSTDEDQHWNFAPGGKRFFIINKCSRRQMVPQHLMCSMYVLSISLDSASPILSFLLSFGQHGTEKMPNGKLEDRSCGWRPFDVTAILSQPLLTYCISNGCNMSENISNVCDIFINSLIQFLSQPLLTFVKI